MAVDDFVSYFKMDKTPFTNTIDTEYLFKADCFLSNQNKRKVPITQMMAFSKSCIIAPVEKLL